jgi:hypothetical protein
MEEAIKFYEWLLKIKSIHLADNERMCKAYAKVIENSNEMKEKYERKKMVKL